jgi:hypothetical protein
LKMPFRINPSCWAKPHSCHILLFLGKEKHSKINWW